jgi:hypothetical protein
VAPPTSPREGRRYRRAGALADSGGAAAAATTTSSPTATAAATVPSLRRIEGAGVFDSAAPPHSVDSLTAVLPGPSSLGKIAEDSGAGIVDAGTLIIPAAVLPGKKSLGKGDFDAGTLIIPAAVLPGKKSLGKGDSAVGKNSLGEGDSAVGKKSLFEGDSAVGKNSLGEGDSSLEGEDSTFWFYNRCLIACSATGVNSTPLEVSTQFMRFLKSAFYGRDTGVEYNFSAVRIQELQMGMLKDPSLSLFSQADNLLIGDICNSASRLLNTPDFDERTLQAIDHLKDFREESDAGDLSSGDDVGGDFRNSGANDHRSDVSSYHPSDSNDADSDFDRKPAAKKKSPKKGDKKRGADVGGGSKQAFGLMTDYVAKSGMLPTVARSKNQVDLAEEYDDAVFQDDEEPEDLSYYLSTTLGKKGRPLSDGGPQRPDTSGMSEAAAQMALKAWRVERKAHNDKVQRLRRKELRDSGNMGSNHTGVLYPQLRNMTSVESDPLLVDHTFPSKDILFIRIAEEANLSGINVSVKRSDDFRVEVVGSKQSKFAVIAACSSVKGWRITVCQTRLEADTTNTDYPTADDHEEDNEHPDDEGLEGDADGLSDDDDGDDEETPKQQRKYKSLVPRTPIKALWLLPFINDKIADTPNISNREMRNLLTDFIRPKFLTASLLQNARKMSRDETFGDPSQNVYYIKGLVAKMEEAGHDVRLVLKNHIEVLKMLERVIVSDEMRKNKSIGKMMSREEKIEFIRNWKDKNELLLLESGLLNVSSDLSFVSGIFFSVKGARDVVPHLQRVFQADACHMLFGKYTLYSCYGTTANCRTFPVAIAIQFGNEDKLGWTQFWDYAKTLHPSLDDKDTTIITDQDKGLRAAIPEVLPSAAPFICSFHREQNIVKYVKGGSGTYSCRWMFKKLLQAHTVAEIAHLKNKHAVHVDDKAWKYLGTVNDEEVYPAARCKLSKTSCMYQRSASSSAESMNNANLAARARTAVDLVSSTMLLLKLAGVRYSAQKEKAWRWDNALTPHGKKLRDDAFEGVNFRHYGIFIDNDEENNDRVSARVTRLGGEQNVERRCWFLKVENDDGSVFGGCSCGVPNTDGIPCHHMIAVVKSGRIDGLTPTNAMPFWWTTECWKRQYPEEVEVSCNFDLSTLRRTPEDRLMRYCPPYTAPNKAGRPKNNKRMKSPVEGTKKRRRSQD